MNVIDKELIVTIDVDQTLLFWTEPTIGGIGKLAIPFTDNTTVYLTPHHYHVELVKRYKQRGYLTIVWSANGYSHALAAVEALKLQDYVDIVMSKPTKYMDDSTAETVLGPRVYCEDLLKPQYVFIPAGHELNNPVLRY